MVQFHGMSDRLDNQAYDARHASNPYALGPVHMGAAAFAAAVITTIVAYLHWLAGVDVPADVIASTTITVGAIVGYLFPNAS